MDPLVLVALVSGALGLAGVLYTAWRAERSSSHTAATQLVESALGETLKEMRTTITDQGRELETHSGRIQTLEHDVSAKDLLVRAASMFIDRIGIWIEGDMKGPKPKPAQLLQKHIDTSFWLDHPTPTD